MEQVFSQKQDSFQAELHLKKSEEVQENLNETFPYKESQIHFAEHLESPEVKYAREKLLQNEFQSFL